MARDAEALFRKNDDPFTTYILRKGTATLELGSGETYEMTGSNRVIGALEVLIAEEDNVPISRCMTFYKSSDAQLIEIAPDKLETLITNDNAGFSITRDIAEIQVWVGEVQQEKNSKVGEKERLKREYAKTYAWAGNMLTKEYKAKRYPWLEKLAQEVEGSLYYAEGMAYLSQDEPKKFEIETKTLNEFSKEFPPGSTVCKQGETGHEMYILNSGKLAIEVNGVQVAAIEDQGAVIGELALLLGKPRAATVKALLPTQITVLKKKEIKNIIQAQPQFLKSMAITLARRVITSVNMIDDLHKAILEEEKEDNKKPEILRENPIRKSIKDLQKKVKALYDQREIDFLDDIYLEMGRRLNAIRKSQ